MTKSLNRSINKKRTAFNNAARCNCGESECVVKHRLCNECNEKIHLDVYMSVASSLPHNLCWNIDHIKDKQFDGTNRNENIVATHPWCNNKKSNITKL
jgi:hypothetical protein